MLSVPPTGSPFDKGDVPNLPWKNWMQDAYRHAKKYQGNGTTAQRPINGVEEGDWYFDTTIGRPVWYLSSAWTDIAERATAAEIKTGTDAVKIVTPSALLAAQGFASDYRSGNQTITSAGTITLTHGLGRMPRIVELWLKCITAEFNYAIGDEVYVTAETGSAGNNNRGISMKRSTSSLIIRYGSDANVFFLPDATTGIGSNLTNANWALIVEAWA